MEPIYKQYNALGQLNSQRTLTQFYLCVQSIINGQSTWHNGKSFHELTTPLLLSVSENGHSKGNSNKLMNNNADASPNIIDCMCANKNRSWRGSNPRPSACKADVITTTPHNQHMLGISVYFSSSVRLCNSKAKLFLLMMVSLDRKKSNMFGSNTWIF